MVRNERKCAVINMLSWVVRATGGADRWSELMFAACETMCKDLC